MLTKKNLFYKLLNHKDEPILLLRPRRFEKFILFDIMKTIFEGKRELFKGLAIEYMVTKYEWNI